MPSFNIPCVNFRKSTSLYRELVFGGMAYNTIFSCSYAVFENNVKDIDKGSQCVLIYNTYFQQPCCHFYCNKCIEYDKDMLVL